MAPSADPFDQSSLEVVVLPPAAPVKAPATEASIPSLMEQNGHVPPAQLWRIHGRHYDLEAFLSSGTHPGGPEILRLSRGLPDVTPLFESYHAFGDMDAIKTTLAKFLVPSEAVASDPSAPRPLAYQYDFHPDGFYQTLKRRVKTHFMARQPPGLAAGRPRSSVGQLAKVNTWWKVKVALQLVGYLSCIYVAFLSSSEAVPRNTSALAAWAAGVLMIGLGMNTFHDASHFAIKSRDSTTNGLVMRAWTAVAIWNPQMWLMHHTVRHHSFTGDAVHDPDTQHTHPFIRKHPDALRSKYISLGPRLGGNALVLTLYSVLIYVLAPGMFLGQVVAYQVLWRFRGFLWKMPLPPRVYQYTWWEFLLSAAILGVHVHRFVASGLGWGLLVSLSYLLGLNGAYALCILPDHDTFECALENRSGAAVIDWGESQVRSSADFGGRGWTGWVFAEFFGGINLQIEHHLFPSVSHVHLHEVAGIVEDCCKEFGVPYVSHGSVTGALLSSLRTIMACMSSPHHSKTRTD